MNLTAKQLKDTIPSLSQAKAEKLAKIMNIVCPLYGINTADIFHEFLATIAHESGEFTIYQENMNYTTAQRIVDVWQSRFNITTAKEFVRNPKALANKVYNGRMGNRIGTDDGWIYRGGGFIQLTGRESYEAYRNYKDKTVSIDQIAELIRTNDSWAIDCACWEFAIDKKLIQAAIDDDFLKITKRINGGTIGWESRLYYYNRAKKYITSI